MKQQVQLPLEGVRVVDFGQQIAGPAVAMVLADLGATVVHIDPPSGPQWKHQANGILNRNKSCLNLDLKTPEGLDQALQLIDRADVVIESFRPGVIQRLGIDFAALRANRPQLISLSVPGFASNDQLRSQWKATEAVVAATAGAFTDMGFNRVLMGLNPCFSPLPLASSYSITMASSSVVLALLARENTGLGDHIEVPVIAAMMEGLSYNSYQVADLPERYKTMREHEIERRRAANIDFDLSYDQLQEYLDPFYRSYKCADDDRSKAIEGEGSAGFQDRVMPSWTPLGFIFPLMWLLIIGPIRAYSSALVFSATGTFFCPAILSLMLHLTIGDVWNTVNNTEKRYGASVVGVLGVVASAVFAATNYFAVAPFAGKILGATCLWLVTASALIADTWRLNGKEPLYPVVGETKTEFAWFASE